MIFLCFYNISIISYINLQGTYKNYKNKQNKKSFENIKYKSYFRDLKNNSLDSF